MKKTKIFSIIAFVVFILAFLEEAVSEILYYAQHSIENLAPQAVPLYTVPMLLGIAMLAVGAMLAAKCKTTLVYPIGFLLLMIPQVTNFVLTACDLAQYGMSALSYYDIRSLLLLIALALLALDAFLLLRNKAMGIIGAALLYVTMFVFNIITTANSGYLFQSMDVFIDGLPRILETMLYYSGMELAAIGTLLYAIGRQPRIPKTAPTPQPVRPPFVYQLPQDGTP